MDPTGGVGWKLIVALIVAVVLLWLFAPHFWAVGISVFLGVVVLGFIFYVLVNARYT